MLDPVLLRTFRLIAEGNSFSEAARRLGLSQSSVSDHIRKLEKSVGHRLVRRDTHSHTLTHQGEAMVEFARIILEANERAERHFAQSTHRRRLRFGASEDLVTTWLPKVLREFAQQNPLVDLEFTIELSASLIAKFDVGELDIVLCKRWPGSERGERLWSDRLVWVGPQKTPVFPSGEVQLVLYPPPSITRFMALATLEKAGVPWRMTCTSGSLSGLASAARAGFGLMVHSRLLIPERLVECDPHESLPKLGELEFVLLRARGRLKEQIAELSAAISAQAKAKFSENFSGAA